MTCPPLFTLATILGIGCNLSKVRAKVKSHELSELTVQKRLPKHDKIEHVVDTDLTENSQNLGGGGGGGGGE